MTTLTIATLPRTRRLGYAVLAVALLAAIVLGLIASGTGWWQLAVFALAPDLALVLGAAPGLANGQLHPRAVGAYNVAHRFWGAVALGALAAFGVLPLGFLVGGLAWAFHVALDRAVGYGLRTRDGFQRA